MKCSWKGYGGSFGGRKVKETILQFNYDLKIFKKGRLFCFSTDMPCYTASYTLPPPEEIISSPWQKSSLSRSISFLSPKENFS